jgi:hypothetical protein
MHFQHAAPEPISITGDRLKESPMRIFSIAVLVAIVLAAGGAFALSFVQETSAQAETTGSARFNELENVNFYGR